MTDIILIRHGETDWNRQMRFQGHSDIALNALGQEQARRVALALAGPGATDRITHLVTSDLIRTAQTAMPLARRLELEPQSRAVWREQAFGDMEGTAVGDMAQTHPELWTQWLRHDPDFLLPGPAESRRQFHARALQALFTEVVAHSERQARNPTEVGTLVVFTHGGLLDMLWRTAQGQSLWGPRTAAIPNTGINRLKVQGEHIDIVSWADDRHLAGLPAQPSTVQAAAAPAVAPPP